MEKRLIVLKLFLAELGEPFQIKTVDQRKHTQKAVYLGQLSKVDLGYRYGWYLMGPYSTRLTRDYYALDEGIERGDKSFETHSLLPAAKVELARFKAILDLPETVDLDKTAWLELLASWHYLTKISRSKKGVATEIIRKNKPNLVQFIHVAENKLNEFNLL